MTTSRSVAAWFAAALGVVLVGYGGASAPSVTDDAMLDRLQVIARELAVANGDATAQGRRAVLTTRGAASRLLGKPVDGADGERPTYLVWMYGNFGPESRKRPVGYLLIGVVDAETARVIDAHVVPGELHPGQPNPEKLGLPELSLAGDVTAPTPDEKTLDRLRSLARSRASFGDDAVATADVFSTNEQDALRTLGYTANGNPDVPAYLLLMEGRFAYNGPRVSRSVSFPPTRFLTLIVIAESLEVRTESWLNRPPRTDALGTAIRLLPWWPRALPED